MWEGPECSSSGPSFLPYSPNLVEGVVSELRLYGVLRSWDEGSSNLRRASQPHTSDCRRGLPAPRSRRPGRIPVGSGSPRSRAASPPRPLGLRCRGPGAPCWSCRGIERSRDPLQGQVGAPALGVAEHHPAVLRGFPGLVAERLAPERQHTVELVATDNDRTDPHRASLEPFGPHGRRGYREQKHAT